MAIVTFAPVEALAPDGPGRLGWARTVLASAGYGAAFGVAVVLPQSSFDLLGLAEAKSRFGAAGIEVMVSSPDAMRRVAMPTRSRIHASFVSTIWARSSLVRTREGW